MGSASPLAALEREGLIRSNAHRDVIVFEPSGSDLREFYEIRIPLEVLATEKAATQLTDRELKKMASLLLRLRGAPTETRRQGHGCA
jgi:DNA-binding GntR family transcriptional regulator